MDMCSVHEMYVPFVENVLKKFEHTRPLRAGAGGFKRRKIRFRSGRQERSLLPRLSIGQVEGDVDSIHLFGGDVYHRRDVLRQQDGVRSGLGYLQPVKGVEQAVARG